ncbi:Serine carboxypeptidase-like 33 [Arabidopsis thaliana]|uniref:Carboxypeptidase n=2 Tax=Arabidopsis TaxID=3701 RepID=A0A178VBK6_ARATH|nr:Peptidase S10 serine carboxypeptidase [Arabidopsis thaliana x Arabidopsis arenosa]OAP02332.1 scpl33 [Arabidopsis thaliana]
MNLTLPMKKQKFLLIISLLILLSLLHQDYHIEAQNSDKVVNLPEQPLNPKISHFSGYVNVNQENTRSLFFWFFEALSESPSTRPLVLWLNGGPGCSSIGYGAASELGPFRVVENGTSLSFNQYSWVQEANMLFLESPVGVGFSYTNSSSDLENLNDAFVAEDAYNFMVAWFARYPQYKSRDFFIAGESYAGHYSPQLAELIYDRNKVQPKDSFINLKGFIVGNPLTDDEYDNKGILEYAWSHAVISDHLYDSAKHNCDFKSSNWSEPCNVAMNTVFTKYKEIDIYNIYAPKCISNSSSGASYLGFGVNNKSPAVKDWFKRVRWFEGYDPCYSNYAEEYFNRVDVRLSLHATTRNVARWKVCNDSILQTYHFTVSSMLPTYSKLIKAGLKIWVYSGDADGRVPVIGSRYCVEALGISVKSEWRSWFHNHQVGGRITEYEGGLTFVTVRGAGHLVPLNKPEEALALFRSFLNGQELPSSP